MQRLLALLLVLGFTATASHDAFAKRRGHPGNQCGPQFRDPGGGGGKGDVVRRVQRLEQNLPEASTFDGAIQLLRNFGAVERTGEFPNLYVFDNRRGARVEAHELYGAQRYSQVVAERGETLLLLPQFEGISIPAIDGLVFDKNGRVKSYFSLKHQFAFKGPQKPISDIRDRLIRFYQNRASWLPLVSLNQGLGVRNAEERMMALAAAFRLLMFSPEGGTTLRTRVVVSTDPHRQLHLDPGQMRSAQGRINQDHRLFESVTMLMPDGAVEVFTDEHGVAIDEAS